jgi:hypothetical protein
MPTLPAELLPFIVEFQPLFSKSVWEHAQILLIGAVLAIGKRTVTACLRVMGKSDDKHFQNYHRVLNRAPWPALTASRLLLRLLIATFALTGELVFGLDDTIERRRGAKIKAKGIYRDGGALLALALRQSQWLALAQLYVAALGALGGSGLGLALSDCAVSLRTVLCGEKSPASKADRARLAGDRIARPLVAGPGAGLRRRQQLCRLRAAQAG